MTIDDAIEQLNEAKCGNCPTLFCEECVKGDKSKQIAEWLEELKDLRTTNAELHDEMQAAIVMQGSLVEESYAKGFNDGCAKFSVGQDYEAGYNKAIDDFEYACVQMIKEKQDTRYGYLNGMDIREIAKKLKVGVKND